MRQLHLGLLGIVLLIATSICWGQTWGGDGTPPQLQQAEVNPPVGYNGIAGYFVTEFQFSVLYSDAEGDGPREVKCQISGPASKHLTPNSSPSSVAPGTTVPVNFTGTFGEAGEYTATFQASDKDGQAPTRQRQFTVRNLPLLLGYVVGGVIGGWLVTNILAIALCFAFTELAASLTAWALYLLALPLLPVSVFRWWDDTTLLLILYGIAVLLVGGLIGWAMLQRSEPQA